MSDRIREKLQILADAAKYDVSCSSSGSNRKNKDKGWAIPAQAFVTLILKMVAVCRCLKFYLAMSVFLTAPIVFHVVPMTFNVLHLPCRKWLI